MSRSIKTQPETIKSLSCQYYVLIDWVGGLDGKIFGSRSGSWPSAKYFPVRLDLTQSIRILSYDHLLLKILKILFEPTRSDLQQKFFIYFFASNKERTIHRKTRLIFSFLFSNSSFSKMAAEGSNKLKLAKIKNVYQHYKEHLYFSSPAKFQHFRCNISWEKCRLKIKKFTDVCMTEGIMYTPRLRFSVGWIMGWCKCRAVNQT